jgi:hypothetical protein
VERRALGDGEDFCVRACEERHDLREQSSERRWCAVGVGSGRIQGFIRTIQLCVADGFCAEDLVAQIEWY